MIKHIYIIKICIFSLLLIMLSSFIYSLPLAFFQKIDFLSLGLSITATAVLVWFFGIKIPHKFFSYELKDIKVIKDNLGYSLIIIGTIFNLLSTLLHIIVDFRLPLFATDLATLTYCFSLVCLICGVYRIGKTRATESKPHTAEIIGVIILITIGLIIRIYKLDAVGHLPEDMLWLDQAYKVLQRTIRSPFIFIGDLSTNMPVYPVAGLYLITHNTYIATRLPSIIYDIFFLFFLYLLTKELFGIRVGFFTLSLAVFSIWDVHNSRLAWHNLTTNAPLISGILFFLVRSIKRGQIKDLFWTGFLTGIAVNLLYIPALMVITVCGYILLTLIITAVKNRFGIRELYNGIIYLCIIGVVIIYISGPTIVKIFKYSKTLFRHSDFIEQNYEKATVSDNKLSYYAGQFIYSLKLFGSNVKNYESDGPWGPALSYPVAWFYHLGLIYSIVTINQATSILLLSTWAIMFIPIVVLYLARSVWRFVDFIPLAFIFTGCGIEFILQITRSVFSGKIAKKALYTASFIILLIITISTLFEFKNFYYLRTNETPNHIFQLCKKVEDELNNNPPEQIIVSDDWCGMVLASVYTDRIPVFIYSDNAPVIDLSQRTAVISTTDIKPSAIGILKYNKFLPKILESFGESQDITTITDDIAARTISIMRY